MGIVHNRGEIAQRAVKSRDLKQAVGADPQGPGDMAGGPRGWGGTGDEIGKVVFKV